MGKKDSYEITDIDKAWVHDSFRWFIEAYGYPSRTATQLSFSKSTFPHSHSTSELRIDALANDLHSIFNIPGGIIQYIIEQDIRDEFGIPFVHDGGVFECDLEVVGEGEERIYKLYIANSLSKHPDRLLFNFIKQFLTIKFLEDNIVGVDDAGGSLFILLSGIYMRLGLIMGQTMSGSGKSYLGQWGYTWNFPPPIPDIVFAYALAFYDSLIDTKNSEWISHLPAHLKKQYIRAAENIKQEGNPHFNKQELVAGDLYDAGNDLYDQQKYEDSIVTYTKATFLSKDSFLLANIYNNIGYSQLRTGDYKASISNFNKAIELNPTFGYAYNNMGFAFIMLGELETGKHYLTVAEETASNDPGYTSRNLALFYQRKGDAEKAEFYFDKAFKSTGLPIDLLELFYAKFMYQRGNIDNAKYWLQKAIDKKDPEAFLFEKEINS